MSLLSNPLLVGFEDIERVLERVAKASGDGYPPYNVERVAEPGRDTELLRITLAVAGFRRDELEVTVKDRELVVRGRQREDSDRVYLHRGIAARRFERVFVLADGTEVSRAGLDNGLLTIDLLRPVPEHRVRRIEIEEGRGETGARTAGQSGNQVEVRGRRNRVRGAECVGGTGTPREGGVRYEQG